MRYGRLRFRGSVATLILSTFAVAALAQQSPTPTSPAPERQPEASSAQTRDAQARETEALEPAVNTSATTTPPSAPSSATSEAPAASASATSPRPAAAQDRPAPRGARAMDRIELDATQVTGNSELPKVLYIVPWKRSDLGDLTGRPVNSLLDEVLMPIDRDVFRRENRYYDALRPDEAAKSAGDER